MSSKQKSAPKSTQELKKEMKRKNTMFSRYLLFRYSLTLFFFANIYWLITQFFYMNWYILIPAINLLILVKALVEQFKLYGSDQVILTWTNRSLRVQTATQLFVIILTLMSQLPMAMPTFANSLPAIILVISLQVIGLLLAYWNIKRSQLISQNQDKFYLRFQNFEKLI